MYISNLLKFHHFPHFLGSCSEKVPRFYYDKQSRKCMKFTYNGCKGNSNRFTSAKECSQECILKRSSESSSGTTTTSGYVITEIIVGIIVFALLAIGFGLGVKYYKIYYSATDQNYRIFHNAQRLYSKKSPDISNSRNRGICG